MKIKNLLLAFAAILLFVSCEKDEDKDLIASKNSHRIKQAVYESGKLVFTYEGENLVKMTQYKKDESEDYIEDYKMEISYSGDNATAITYTKYSGIWEIFDKVEYFIQNGLMMEEHYYDYEDGNWEEEWKWTYQYSGSNITAWQNFYYNDEDGTFDQDSKGEYFYQNSELAEYKEYEIDESGNWSQYMKETFAYDGSNLINWIGYGLDESDNWENNYKFEYQYSGDKVSQMAYFYWDSEDSQWESQNLVSFNYNSNGYVSEVLQEINDDITYEYEEGHGNARLFLVPQTESVYGGPTIKSTGNRNRKYVPYYQRLNNR